MKCAIKLISKKWWLTLYIIFRLYLKVVDNNFFLSHRKVSVYCMIFKNKIYVQKSVMNMSILLFSLWKKLNNYFFQKTFCPTCILWSDLFESNNLSYYLMCLLKMKDISRINIIIGSCFDTSFFWSQKIDCIVTFCLF